jgi:hypothetical protein
MSKSLMATVRGIVMLLALVVILRPRPVLAGEYTCDEAGTHCWQFSCVIQDSCYEGHSWLYNCLYVGFWSCGYIDGGCCSSA